MMNYRWDCPETRYRGMEPRDERVRIRASAWILAGIDVEGFVERHFRAVEASETGGSCTAIREP